MENCFDKVTILVVSCDKYIDVLTPFTDLFEHYWPDCPIKKKCILLNELTFSASGWETINVGEDKSWSSNLRIATNKISTEYVLIFFEDMFLSKRVDNDFFRNYVNAFMTTNADYLKLLSAPKPNGKKVNQYFGEIQMGDIYRSTAPAAIFKIKILQDLLSDRENAWQFEINGSQRSVKYDSFYSVYNSVFKFEHGIVRGKYLRPAYSFLQGFYGNSFKTDREIYTKSNICYLKYRSLRKFIFRLIVPIRYRHYIRKIFKGEEY